MVPSQSQIHNVQYLKIGVKVSKKHGNREGRMMCHHIEPSPFVQEVPETINKFVSTRLSEFPKVLHTNNTTGPIPGVYSNPIHKYGPSLGVSSNPSYTHGPIPGGLFQPKHTSVSRI